MVIVRTWQIADYQKDLEEHINIYYDLETLEANAGRYHSAVLGNIVWELPFRGPALEK